MRHPSCPRFCAPVNFWLIYFCLKKIHYDYENERATKSRDIMMFCWSKVPNVLLIMVVLLWFIFCWLLLLSRRYVVHSPVNLRATSRRNRSVNVNLVSRVLRSLGNLFDITFTILRYSFPQRISDTADLRLNIALPNLSQNSCFHWYSSTFFLCVILTHFSIDLSFRPLLFSLWFLIGNS